ncbi:MAG: four helix bundle protein [Saprospiraceae bacterium]|nr:four helix bundle protein [Saprospiraceae bacterium]
MKEEIRFGEAVAYYRKNLVFNKSYLFSINIINLFKELKKKKEFELGKQLLRSGTSIGANIMEATAASSTKDFAHRMSIASREARESLYWLSLLKDCNHLQATQFHLIEQCEEIIKILTSIIKSINTKASN